MHISRHRSANLEGYQRHFREVPSSNSSSRHPHRRATVSPVHTAKPFRSVAYLKQPAKSTTSKRTTTKSTVLLTHQARKSSSSTSSWTQSPAKNPERWWLWPSFRKIPLPANSPTYRLTRGIQFPNKTIPLKTPVLRGISLWYNIWFFVSTWFNAKFVIFVGNF